MEGAGAFQALPIFSPPSPLLSRSTWRYDTVIPAAIAGVLLDDIRHGQGQIVECLIEDGDFKMKRMILGAYIGEIDSFINIMFDIIEAR